MKGIFITQNNKINLSPYTLITTNVIIIMLLLFFSCENTITDNPDILDCNNVPNGSASLDDCGDCVAPEDFNGAQDCTGVCDGSSSFDNCGVCYPGGQDASFEAGKCVLDCFGAWGGTAVIDDCGVCDATYETQPEFPYGICDCYGTPNGDSILDGCSDCVGGNTDLDPCPNDCNGVPGGGDVVDNCGTCDNDSFNDCVLDCAGIWGGSSIDDDCGICGGDNSTCIVINEINYNSSDVFNPEDWVELYNSSESPINIGTWKLKDEANDHVFIIPENTILLAGNFIVLCKDSTAFTSLFPEVTNFIGDLGFGLGGGGDMVRLFDSYEQLIDVVEYDDEGEWLVEADGTGATLELIHPSLDNTSATNWGYSIDYGTPGEINSVYDDE